MENLIELIRQAEKIEQLAEYIDNTDLLMDRILLPSHYTYKGCDEYNNWISQLKQGLSRLKNKVNSQDFQELIDAIYELENNNYGERTAFRKLKVKLEEFMKLDA